MTVSMQIDYGAATTSLRKVFAIVKSDVAALRDLLARRGGSACVPAAVWDAPAHLAQVLAGLPSFLRDAYTHLRELVPDGMPEFPVYGLRASGYALFPSPPPAPTPKPNTSHFVRATRTAAGDFDDCVLFLPGIRYVLELHVAPAAYFFSASPRTRESSCCMHACTRGSWIMPKHKRPFMTQQSAFAHSMHARMRACIRACTPILHVNLWESGWRELYSSCPLVASCQRLIIPHAACPGGA
jgi:hypothetical protein